MLILIFIIIGIATIGLFAYPKIKSWKWFGYFRRKIAKEETEMVSAINQKIKNRHPSTLSKLKRHKR